MNSPKFIHLLYVPTLNCNFACKYCYLEDNTKELETEHGVLDTLKYAVEKFWKSDVIPYNMSLHGGEVTTLSKKDFHDVVEYVFNYYHKHAKLIKDNGFKIGKCHIKTNLFAVDKHIDTIKKFNVSVSGSIDLPLRLHNDFRVTKNGEKTLEKILANLKLLEDTTNRKKCSATIFKQHYDHLDEIIKDIKFLEENTCLDMNDFNFMLGFEGNSNGLLTSLKDTEQADFFHAMHKEFDGSSLDKGVNGAWFAEFSTDYCTSGDNCGEKFFLLERNGDIYSCVRGQGHSDFYYGNIYKDTVNDILENAKNRIFMNHNKVGFNEECGKCCYLHYCKTGCPFVKNAHNSDKSYTCLLQKELYKSKPTEYPEDENNKYSVFQYISKMHPHLMTNYLPKPSAENNNPTLEEIIAKDRKLKYIYDSEVFVLSVNHKKHKLESQIIKNTRDIVYFTDDSEIKIYIKNDLLDQECDYPQNNSLYIIILTGDTIEYGDEGRNKQRHLITHQVYKGVLEKNESDIDGYFVFNLVDILKSCKTHYSVKTPNNILFTTSALRDCHYNKQKNNAFYHLQAINLPFQNIEFFYIESEDTK